MRVGTGVDAHRFGGVGPLLLGGVVVEEDRGVVATSDGDVLAHAVADALLGAAALGDLGDMFPNSDPAWQGADSMGLLRQVVSRISDEGFVVEAVDATIVAETVRIAPHRKEIRAGLAECLGIPDSRVSVKATSTDGLGFTGSDQGIAVLAVAVLTEN